VSPWLIRLPFGAFACRKIGESLKIRENPGMNAAEIREEVLDILRDIAPDEDLSQLDDEKRFREQLELDSMDFLDIVMELRKRHRIQIPEDDYVQLASMASTVAFLEPLMKDIEREKV
jgi:acyl carrier protein